MLRIIEQVRRIWRCGVCWRYSPQIDWAAGRRCPECAADEARMAASPCPSPSDVFQRAASGVPSLKCKTSNLNTVPQSRPWPV